MWHLHCTESRNYRPAEVLGQGGTGTFLCRHAFLTFLTLGFFTSRQQKIVRSTKLGQVFGETNGAQPSAGSESSSVTLSWYSRGKREGHRV